MLWTFKKQYAMKKLIYSSIIILAAVSCAKEMQPNGNVETPKGELKTFTIGASIDNSTINPDSKANLDAETLQVLWQAKDTIGLVTADGVITPAALVEGSEGNAQGYFAYEAEEELEVVYAYYPYTSKAKVCQQSVVDGKLTTSLPQDQDRPNNGLIVKNTLIMVAKVQGSSVMFKNTCAIAKISVKGSSVVTRHLYVATPEAALSGAGTVDMTSDTPVFVADAIDELSLDKNSKGTRYSYIDIDAKGVTITPGDDYVFAGYMVLPAGTYHSLGFELLATVGEDSKYCLSKSPVKDITLNAGKIRPLNVTIEEPTQFIDLSAGGKYANCYMIQNETGENFGFGLYTRKYASGVATKIELTDYDKSFHATVLWQSTEGLISDVTFNKAQKMIYFKRDTRKIGNAVIALRNRDGQVIYSWNIWVPGEAVGTNAFGDYELMDRNLGSYGTNSHTKIGAFYQQGRKDPFPGASSGTKQQNSAVVYPDVIKTVKAQDGKAQTWADTHPNVFIWGTDNSGRQDWRNAYDNNLWVSSSTYLKRPQDPCPYGYRVPITDEFDNMKLTDLTGTGTYSDMFVTVKDKNQKDAVFAIGGVWQRKTQTIEMTNIDVEGYLWCGNGSSSNLDSQFPNPANTDITETGTYRIQFKKDNCTIVKTKAQVRRWGSNVRCVKFTEVDAE